MQELTLKDSHWHLKIVNNVKYKQQKNLVLSKVYANILEAHKGYNRNISDNIVINIIYCVGNDICPVTKWNDRDSHYHMFQWYVNGSERFWASKIESHTDISQVMHALGEDVKEVMLLPCRHFSDCIID